MAPSASELEPAILVLVVVAFLFARRVVSSYRGAPVSTGRLVGYAAFVLVVFAFTVLSGLFFLPWWSVPIDACVVVVAALLGARHVARTVVLEERSPGTWYFRLGVAIPVVYLVLFVARIVIDLVVLNYDPFTGPPSFTSVSGPIAALLVGVDALFALSAGLVVGRTVGVLRAVRARAHS